MAVSYVAQFTPLPLATFTNISEAYAYARSSLVIHDSNSPSFVSVRAKFAYSSFTRYEWYNLAFILAIMLFVLRIWQNSLRTSKLDAPIVRFPGLLGYFFSGLMFITRAPEVVQLGYRIHGGKPFQISTFYGNELYVCDPKKVKELADAPEPLLSAKIATNQMAGLIYAFPDCYSDDSLKWSVIGQHLHQLVRTKLNKNVCALIPELRDEIAQTFDAVMAHVPKGEFASFKGHDTALKIVGRVTNRVVVGAPLCRNQTFVQTAINHAVSACIGGALIRMFPTPLKKLASKYLTWVEQASDAAVTYIEPIVSDLFQKATTGDIDELEEENKTMLYWISRRAIQKGFNWTPRMIAMQMLFVNFGAIHTTSAALGHLLYELALRPEYIKPILDEVEEVVAIHGWTKEGIDAMWKLDSFIRESQRLHPLSTTALWRHARKDFTFSDGFHVPAGTWISAPSEAINRFSGHYENATEFDGFRFSRIRHIEGDAASSTTTGVYNMNYGTGSHSCPGRFLANLELKLILIHFMQNYEARLTQPKRPKNFSMNIAIFPNLDAEILLRQRVVLDN